MDEPKETPEVFTRDAPRTHTHTHGGVVGNMSGLQKAHSQQNQTPPGRTRNRRVLLVRHRLEDELQHCSKSRSGGCIYVRQQTHTKP